MIIECANDGEYTAYRCNDCGSIMRYHRDCKRRVCFSCNIKRSKKLIDKYKNIDNYLIDGNTFFVTLTIKNTKSVVDGVVRIRKAFKDLCRRHPYNRWFAGGLYAIECELNKEDNTFNIHIHACIDSCVDIKKAHYKTELNEDWYAVTGDSYITDWEETRHPKSAIGYCLKYTTKAVDYADREEEIEESLKGIRMLTFFGVFYNLKGIPVFKKDFVCLACNSDNIFYYFSGNIHDSEFKLIAHSLTNINKDFG